MIGLASYKGKGNLFNRLIRLWTFGPYSHSEFVFSDGICFSSSTRVQDDFKTRFKRVDLNNGNWDVIWVPVSKELEADAREFAKSESGKPYDWRGIMFSQIIPWNDHRKDHWFCSEITARLLQICQVEQVLGKKPNNFSPNSLASALKEAI